MLVLMVESGDDTKINRVSARYYSLVNRLLSVSLVRRTQMELWKLRMKQMKQILLNQMNNDVAGDQCC
jgi:hypothetical protein